MFFNVDHPISYIKYTKTLNFHICSPIIYENNQFFASPEKFAKT